MKPTRLRKWGAQLVAYRRNQLVLRSVQVFRRSDVVERHHKADLPAVRCQNGGGNGDFEFPAGVENRQRETEGLGWQARRSLEVGLKTGIILHPGSEQLTELSHRLPQGLFNRDSGQTTGLLVPMCHYVLTINEDHPDADRIDQGREQGQASRSGEIRIFEFGLCSDFLCDVAPHRVDQSRRFRRNRRPVQPAVRAIAAFVAILEVDNLGPFGEVLDHVDCRESVVGMDEIEEGSRHKLGIREAERLGPRRIEMLEEAVIPSHAKHVNGERKEAFVHGAVQHRRALQPLSLEVIDRAAICSLVTVAGAQRHERRAATRAATISAHNRFSEPRHRGCNPKGHWISGHQYAWHTV